MAISVFEHFRRLFPLQGSKVELCLFGKEHLNEKYLCWLNDPDVVRFSNQRFRLHDETSSQTYLHSVQEAGNLFLAIRLARTGRFVGTMTVKFSIPHETADMSILIGDRSCWGQGVGKDAWSALMSLLLESGRVRKLTGGTLRCNVGMVKVMTNSGMSPDGIRVGQELVDGLPQDILYFARFCNE